MRSRVLLGRSHQDDDRGAGAAIDGKAERCDHDSGRQETHPQGREERPRVACYGRRFHRRAMILASPAARGASARDCYKSRSRVVEPHLLSRWGTLRTGRQLRCREGSVASGGQTTVIQRILERRAERPPTTTEETTASIAVMLRVVPPPKALLAITEPVLRQQIERRILGDMLDFVSVADETEALRRFVAEFRQVVITDSLDMVRRLRARRGERSPVILYIAELDDSAEREAGLVAGADDCVGRRASEREVDARIAAARRIAELEAVLRITLAENRKLSATDDLTRVASRRFFSKHFPREMERAARYGRGAVAHPVRHRLLQEYQRHASATPAGDQILGNSVRACSRTCAAASTGWRASAARSSRSCCPETGYEPALEVARKLRVAIAQHARSLDRQERRGHRELRAVRTRPRAGRRAPARPTRAEDRRRRALPQQERRPQSRHCHDVRWHAVVRRPAARTWSGEKALTVTQVLAGARPLRPHAGSVHIVMHKFCG